MTVAWRRSPSSPGPAAGPAVRALRVAETAAAAASAVAALPGATAGATSAPQPVQKRCPAKTGVAHLGQGTPTEAPHAAQNRAPAGISASQRAQVIGVRAARKRHHRPAAQTMASAALCGGRDQTCSALAPDAGTAPCGAALLGIQSSAFLRLALLSGRGSGTKAASLRPRSAVL